MTKQVKPTYKTLIEQAAEKYSRIYYNNDEIDHDQEEQFKFYEIMQSPEAQEVIEAIAREAVASAITRLDVQTHSDGSREAVGELTTFNNDWFKTFMGEK